MDFRDKDWLGFLAFVLFLFGFAGGLFSCMERADRRLEDTKAARAYCRAVLATARTAEDTVRVLDDTTTRYRCERYMEVR